MENEEVRKEPLEPEKLNTDPDTWEGMLNTFLLWVMQDPWTFLTYVGVILAPLLLISAALSWKMAKTLEKQEKAANKPRRRSPRKTAKMDWRHSRISSNFRIYLSTKVEKYKKDQ